jgi:hypothetical protein
MKKIPREEKESSKRKRRRTKKTSYNHLLSVTPQCD